MILNMIQKMKYMYNKRQPLNFTIKTIKFNYSDSSSVSAVKNWVNKVYLTFLLGQNFKN